MKQTGIGGRAFLAESVGFFSQVFMFLGLTFVLAACDKAADEWVENNFQNPAGDAMGGGSVVADASGDDLETFTVSLNTSALAETEVLPTDASDELYEDYVENVERDDAFKNHFTITYSGNDVTIEGYDESDTDFLFVKEGAHLTVTAQKKARYTLSGESADGSLTIMGEEKKAWVELAGLKLTNPTGPALQKLTDKRMYLTVAEGTANTLCDGTSYADETQKATLYSKGKLIVNGLGQLTVQTQGAGKNALMSSDYVRFRKNTNVAVEVSASSNNGVRGKDAILTDGGVLNVSVASAAGKGLSTDGYMEVNGGRLTVITTGGGVYADGEASACACIKTDSIFRLNAGELWLKSTGAGGKGISSDQEIYLNGGKLRVITTGARYAYGSSSGSGRFGGNSSTSANRTSPKGIKSDKNIYVSGGDIAVKCTGGEGSEGVESKASIAVSGGTLQASCYDDCINAAANLQITGGNIYAYSSTNDGIDSNGNIQIGGGVVVASGATTPEEGIDCDQNNFAITGGLVIGVGGASSTPTANSCTQPVLIYGGSVAQGTLVTLADGNGSHVLSYAVPRSYGQQMTLLVSSPWFASGSTYYLYTGSTLSATTAFHGLQWGGAIESAGSSLTTATLNGMVTTVGNTGGGMGGGPGDGRMPGGIR